MAWGFSGLGLLSLLWFLVRVIPKPSRASYPCQRVAFPLASSFVLWVAAVLGSAWAWRKARRWNEAYWRTCLWGVLAAVCMALVVVSTPVPRVQAGNPPHGPLGVANGIFPGRVAWVHAPDATSWDGESSPEYWWDPEHTDLATVEVMMSKALRCVSGAENDAAAWDALFRHFNVNRGRGQRGYLAGEKIAIKLNLTACNARSGTSTVNLNGSYEKKPNVMNTIDNSPQMVLALLRQLVYEAGVSQENIYLGDPTGNFPQFLWNMLHPEFPEVHYFDNYGGAGRERVTFSTTPFHWSSPNAAGKLQDYVPTPFAQAAYLINFALLKGHSVGVTVCGKNWYGGLLRCPDGYYRDANGPNQGGNLNYLNMHESTPDPGMAGATPGLGHYRAIVDLMGHPALGGKTLLCLVDGLFGGYFWDSHPSKWNMSPFNGDWPSSLFASVDPVAIDSVCYDFLLQEWPNVVNNGNTSSGTRLQGGAEDYLHEAAEAESPPSGTSYDPGRTGRRLSSLGAHEHWNNVAEKKYSRNLGTGEGIELVQLTASRPSPMLSLRRSAGEDALTWRSSQLGYAVQRTATLPPNATWLDVAEPPSVNGWLNAISRSSAESSQFYRLVKLPPPATAPTYGNNSEPWVVTPGGTLRLQAENFDTGGEGVAYHDTEATNLQGAYRTEGVDIGTTTDGGAGHMVSTMRAGEWCSYSVKVMTSGNYTLRLRVARQTAGNATVWVSAKGVDKTANWDIPSTTGWQTWTTVSKSVKLSAGIQELRLNMVTEGLNLNWLELSGTN